MCFEHNDISLLSFSLIQEVILQNLGQTQVSLASGQMHNIEYQFCMEPGVYIDNLYFEAYSETTLGYEEVITIAYLQFNKSFNFPGLQFPQAQVLVDVRKPTGQRYSMRTSAGPVYNSGMRTCIYKNKPQVIPKSCK